MTNHRIEEPPEAPPSILDELQGRARDLLRGVLAERLKASFDRALEWTFRRVLTYLTAAAFFVTAVVFALIAGRQGLEQAGAPPWAAHLALGLVGAMAGAMLLRCPQDRGPR